jgi:hypothetical protein
VFALHELHWPAPGDALNVPASHGAHAFPSSPL